MKTIISLLSLVLTISLKAQTCTVQMVPLSQNVNCNLTTIQNVTLTASSANVIHTIKAPMGGVVTMTSNPAVYQPIGLGTYTYLLTDAVTGCTNSSQFMVGSMSAFPTFSMDMSVNYTLGCAPKDVGILSINSVSATLPTYTLLSPNSSSVLPNTPYSIQSSFNINSVGIWTVVVRADNGCQTRVPFSVYSNTVTPTYTLSNYASTLTCSSPTTVLSGLSSSNSFINTQTVTTSTLTALKGLISNFTLTAMDTVNGCSSGTILPIFQNIISPTLNISLSHTLDCYTSEVLIEPFQPNLNYNFNWIPSGLVTPAALISNSGTYTLQITDPDNGCETLKAITVHGCATVGIDEYAPSLNLIPIYYDLMGNEIKKRYNEVIIEKIGNKVRKLIIWKH